MRNLEDITNLIQQMKREISGEQIRCYRSLRGKFDGKFNIKLAPDVKPQNFKFIFFINLNKQQDPKAIIIDNSYAIGYSWKVAKHGSVDDDLFVLDVYTEQNATIVFEMKRSEWNFLQVDINAMGGYISIQTKAGVTKETIQGKIRYPAKTELTIGGNKTGCFFVGEICYYGLWEL